MRNSSKNVALLATLTASVGCLGVSLEASAAVTMNQQQTVAGTLTKSTVTCNPSTQTKATAQQDPAYVLTAIPRKWRARTVPYTWDYVSGTWKWVAGPVWTSVDTTPVATALSGWYSKTATRTWIGGYASSWVIENGYVYARTVNLWSGHCALP